MNVEGEPRYSLQRETGKDYTLTLTALELSDGGTYRCEVSVQFPNPFVAENSPVNLIVYGMKS